MSEAAVQGATEEINDTGTVDETEPNADGSSDASAGAESDADESRGNAWDQVTRAIREMGSEKKADADSGDGKQDEGTKDSDDGDDADDESQDADEDEQEKKEAPKPKPNEQRAGGRPRYAILGPDGKPAGDVEWEEGTVLKFRGDGRDLEVKSFDDLIGLAQKGAAFDRQSSTQGQEIARLKGQTEEVRNTAEQTLMAVLFGTDKMSAEDIQEQLREDLAKFRDPEFREGQEAKQREQKRTAREADERNAQVQKLNEGIWHVAREQFGDELSSYPYLDATDEGEVMQRVYQRYNTRFTELVRSYEAAAREKGVPIEQAHALAQQEALPVLSEETLRDVMQEVNDRYAAKAGTKKPGRSKPASPSKPEDSDDDGGDEGEDEPDLEAEAAAHNRRVEQKLEQRQRARTLKGGGAPPSSERAEPKLEGLSWNDKMAAMKRVLRGGRA